MTERGSFRLTSEDRIETYNHLVDDAGGPTALMRRLLDAVDRAGEIAHRDARFDSGVDVLEEALDDWEVSPELAKYDVDEAPYDDVRLRKDVLANLREYEDQHGPVQLHPADVDWSDLPGRIPDRAATIAACIRYRRDVVTDEVVTDMVTRMLEDTDYVRREYVPAVLDRFWQDPATINEDGDKYYTNPDAADRKRRKMVAGCVNTARALVAFNDAHDVETADALEKLCDLDDIPETLNDLQDSLEDAMRLVEPGMEPYGEEDVRKMRRRVAVFRTVYDGLRMTILGPTEDRMREMVEADTDELEDGLFDMNLR